MGPDSEVSHSQQGSLYIHILQTVHLHDSITPCMARYRINTVGGDQLSKYVTGLLAVFIIRLLSDPIYPAE